MHEAFNDLRSGYSGIECVVVNGCMIVKASDMKVRRVWTLLSDLYFVWRWARMRVSVEE